MTLTLTLTRALFVVLMLGGAAACGSGRGSSTGAAGNGGTQGAAGQAGADGVAITPVGAPRGAKVEGMIAPAGGTLESADGRLRIDVPAGALAAAATLAVQTIANQAPGGLGPAYRLGPEGTTFASPVKLTFTFDDQDVAGSEPTALGIAFQDGMARWNGLVHVTRDDVARTIAVETTHFSDWALFAGWRLVPAAARLLPGAALALTLEGCGVDPSADDIVELRHPCRTDGSKFTAEQWTVNGVLAGNATVGRVAPEGDNGATYTAPAVAPPNNPMAVSVAATEKASGRKTIFISSIYIDAFPPLVGTATSRHEESNLGLVVTTSASVTFKFDESNMLYRPSSGTLTATRDIVGVACVSHATAASSLGSQDGTIVILELGYYATGAKTLTFVGTTACGGGAPEPFTIDEEIEWLPGPIDAILGVKPEGKLDDGYVDQLLGSGARVSAEWTLVPSRAP